MSPLRVAIAVFALATSLSSPSFVGSPVSSVGVSFLS
jgi:hypothetical protein